VGEEVLRDPVITPYFCNRSVSNVSRSSAIKADAKMAVYRAEKSDPRIIMPMDNHFPVVVELVTSP